MHNHDNFTHQEYEALLKLTAKHLPFVSFKDYQTSKKGVFWRHDLDMSVDAALVLAQIEARCGLKSTYFLQMHSHYYNLFEPETTASVRQIIGLGHSIGVHFDAGAYPQPSADKEWITQITHEKNFLENYFNAPIHAFSFHNPTAKQIEYGEDVAGMVNTYNRYFRKEVVYLSDSRGKWNDKTVSELMKQNNPPQLLHVLTHPEWWTEIAEENPVIKMQDILEGQKQKSMQHTLSSPYYKAWYEKISR